MNSTSNKWSCSFCTYENWPSSKKCALCDNEKLTFHQLTISSTESTVSPPPTAVVVDKTNELTNVDCPDVITYNRPTPPTIIENTNQQHKWSCAICTYMNWPKSRKCVQCFSSRQVINNSPLPSPPKESSDNTNIIENVNENESSQSINSLDAALQKWTCNLCTYHNWPKASHCTMCKHPRQKENIENSSLLTEKDRDSPLDNCRTSGIYKSPPRSPLSQTKQSSSWINRTTGTIGNNNHHPTIKPWSEDTLRRIKMSCINNHLDFLWLNACRGAVEGDLESVESYLAEPKSHVFRKLIKNECRILNRSSVFEPGLTLAKLATRSGHQHVVDLLACEWLILGSGCRKRMPCHLSPDLAREICHHFLVTLHQGKMDFNCYFVRDCFTFALPRNIELLPRKTKNILLAQTLDINVQHELEYKEKVINWWCENPAGCKGGERNALFALWNRTAGDCLLDSALQAVLGVLDRENALRSVLTDSLIEAQAHLYDRWRLYEITRARSLGYQLDELQLRHEWSSLVRSARQPGEPLEHGHIFALAHIFRRPIIVYGVKYIHNNRAEPIGYANYQGLYLPFLWESDFCFRQPIVLGYTRGHFSALVSMETLSNDACVNSPHDVATVLINSDSAPLAACYNSIDFPHEIPGGSSHISSTASKQFIYSGSGAAYHHHSHPHHPHLSLHTHHNLQTPESHHKREESCEVDHEGMASDMADRENTGHYVVYLPLFDCHGMRLPIHFLSPEQAVRQDEILNEWLDISYNRIGLPLVCQRWRPRQNPLVTQMLDQWLHFYQQLSLSAPPLVGGTTTVPKSDPASPALGRKSQSPSQSELNDSPPSGGGGGYSYRDTMNMDAIGGTIAGGTGAVERVEDRSNTFPS